jgi:hypothetical protein
MSLNYTECYTHYCMQIPYVKDVKTDIEESNLTQFNKRLLKILHRERFKDGKSSRNGALSLHVQ